MSSVSDISSSIKADGAETVACVAVWRGQSLAFNGNPLSFVLPTQLQKMVT